jgi:hypothetical protein
VFFVLAITVFTRWRYCAYRDGLLKAKIYAVSYIQTCSRGLVVFSGSLGHYHHCYPRLRPCELQVSVAIYGDVLTNTLYRSRRRAGSGLLTTISTAWFSVCRSQEPLPLVQTSYSLGSDHSDGVFHCPWSSCRRHCFPQYRRLDYVCLLCLGHFDMLTVLLATSSGTFPSPSCTPHLFSARTLHYVWKIRPLNSTHRLNNRNSAKTVNVLFHESSRHTDYSHSVCPLIHVTNMMTTVSK